MMQGISLCDHVTERAGGGVCQPHSKPRLCLFAMGRSGGTSCPNDRAERYRSMQSRYRTRQTKIYLFAMGRSGDISRLNDDATSSVFTTLLSNATSELQCISICHSRDIVCDEHKLLVCVTWSRVSLFACFVPVVF